MTRTTSDARRVLATALACLVLAASVQAMYMRPDLEEVPVERLIANLGEKVKEKPADATLLFNLARTHAMAYASKAQVTKVWRGREARGPWFGFEPRYVPYRVKKPADAAQQKAAQRHLAQAIALHGKVLELKPDHGAARMGYGWLLQQAGRTAEAIRQLRKTIDDAWQTEQKRKLAGLGPPPPLDLDRPPSRVARHGPPRPRPGRLGAPDVRLRLLLALLGHRLRCPGRAR